MKTMKLLSVAGLYLLFAFVSRGALVVNGDMSFNSYATGGNNAKFQDLDQGWAVKAQSSLDLSANPGKMTWDGGATTLPDSLAQINSVSNETGNTLVFSFEWTPAAGSAHPTLDYNLVGWKVTGSPASSNDFFNAINGGGNSASGLDGHADAIDLRTGTNLGSGNNDMSVGSVTGTAGSTTNYTVSIDMRDWAAGLNNITNYDYVGVRFKIPGDHTDLSAVGSTLDNVELTATNFVEAPFPPRTGFYTDYIDLVSDTVDLVADYGASGSDTNDDSAALQTAIDDMTALPKGGKITIPSGTFYFIDILMKDNVHIEIDSGATLKPVVTAGAMFFFGLDNKGANAAVTVSNVSIRGVGGHYTVDFTACPPSPNKMQFAKIMNVNNYMIADFYAIDNLTKMNVLNFGYSEYGGVYYQPVNGLIKNGDVENAHDGYGLCQVQCASNHLFKDLAGQGGYTLRLETGALLDPPEYIKLDEIYGTNISIRNGTGAVLCNPHTRDNGHVDIRYVTAVSSLYAVKMRDGYVSSEEEAAGYTPGSFAASGIVSDVHAVYGESAHLASKNFDEIPCAIRHLISVDPIYTNSVNIYSGPSAVAVLDFNSAINTTNVTQEGFLHKHVAVETENDPYTFCYMVPVTNMTLTPASASLAALETVQLTASISPVDASEPTVNWSSDNLSVAMVSDSGLVTALAEGTAIITATTVDGGYTRTCSVSVSGAAPGGTFVRNPDADTYAYKFKANESYGSDVTMRTKGAVENYTRESFLRFNVSLLPGGAVTNALLRMKVSGENGSDLDAHDAAFVTDDSWDESSVTWSNKPAYGATLDTQPRPAIGEWIEFDVTEQVNTERNGDGLFSVALRSLGDAVISWHTKEAASSNDWPQLVVTTADPATGWETYVSDLGLSGITTNDYDNDGVSDLVEYALAGNATNPNVTAISPYLILSGSTASYFHEQLTNSNPGITYVSEWTDDLVDGTWTNAWDGVVSRPSTNAGFDELEHQLNPNTGTNSFFRLRISCP